MPPTPQNELFKKKFNQKAYIQKHMIALWLFALLIALIVAIFVSFTVYKNCLIKMTPNLYSNLSNWKQANLTNKTIGICINASNMAIP